MHPAMLNACHKLVGTLMQSFGDDGILQENFERNDLQSSFMRGLEHNGAGRTRTLHL